MGLVAGESFGSFGISASSLTKSLATRITRTSLKETSDWNPEITSERCPRVEKHVQLEVLMGRPAENGGV